MIKTNQKSDEEDRILAYVGEDRVREQIAEAAENIIFVENFTSAKEEIRRKKPELTIIDIQRTDGMRLLSEAIKIYPETPIVVIAPLEPEYQERLKILSGINNVGILHTPIKEGTIDTIIKSHVKGEIIRNLQEKTQQKIISSTRNLERLVEENPSDEGLVLHLGLAYGEQNDYNRAIGTLENLKRINPKNVDCLYNLGIFKILKAKGNSHKGLLESAEKDFTDIIDVNEGKARFGLGILSMDKKMFKEAIKDLEKVIEIDPEFIEAYLNLAEAYRHTNQKDKAKVMYYKAIRRLSEEDFLFGIKPEIGLTMLDLSQNLVYGIVSKKYTGPNIVLKIYKRGKKESGINENQNITILRPLIRTIATPQGYRVELPSSEIFKYPPYLLNVLDRRVGMRISTLFESVGKSTKLKHLEWIVDFTALLGYLGKKHKDQLLLKDVRQETYKNEFLNGKNDIKYYMNRLFIKFVDQIDEARGKSLIDKEKLKLRKEYTQIEEQLISAPDFLYLFYTDSNIRNFLISIKPKDLTKPEEVLEDFLIYANKTRLDLESKEIKLGYIDALTSIEHELSGLTKADRDYLINRWLLNILQFNIAEKGGDIDYITNILSDKDSDRRKIYHALGKSINEFCPEYNLEYFYSLSLFASLHRHLTITGDKARDLQDLQSKTDKIIGDDNFLRDIKSKFYEEQDFSFPEVLNLKEALLQDGDFSSAEKLNKLNDYFRFINIVNGWQGYHINVVGDRLNKLSLSGLRDILIRNYEIFQNNS